MPEKFQCPSCGGGIDYDGRDAATMRCPYCNTSIVIPESLRPTRTKPEPQVIDATRTAQTPTIVTVSGAPQVVRLDGAAGTAVKGAVGCGVFGILLSAILPIVLTVAILAGVWYFLSTTIPGMSGAGDPFAELGIEMPGVPGVPGIAPAYAPVSLKFGAEGTGAGSFQQAWLGGVDGDGRIYVLDNEGSRVQVFNSEGKFETQWTPDGEGMRSMAVARDGTVYLVYSGKINKFNGPDGEPLGHVIAAGTAVGSGVPLLDDVYFEEVALTPDGGMLAIAEGTVYRFNSKSEITLEIPNAIEEITGESQSTLEVAEDGLGNIYIASQRENSIFKFDSEGQYQQRFGSEGDAQDQFLGFIDGLAVDNKGRLYTVDFKGIQVFDSESGRWLAQIDDPETGLSIYDLAVSPDNHLLAVATTRIFTFNLPE